jgi:hypothetical protein
MNNLLNPITLPTSVPAKASFAARMIVRNWVLRSSRNADEIKMVEFSAANDSDKFAEVLGLVFIR